MIPYGRQSIEATDIDAVVDVLHSDFLTQGPAIPAFEQMLAHQCGARYAVAVSSATAALHISCEALGLGPGDCLWTVPNSFVASANCARYCGADVDFVDIDPRTWNMSVACLAKKLHQARLDGCLPKIVVPVHFAGQPAEQEAIWNLAGEFGFKVLEDASHAIGASTGGESVGSCRWSHAAVFSFHPVKIVTTGEGGAVLANDESLVECLRLLRSHGITRDPARFVATGEMGGWYYEQQTLGFNYRMTDIQAALGASQLCRLPNFLQARKELAQVYDRELAKLPVELPTVRRDCISAWHLYVVRVSQERTGVARGAVYEALKREGVGANVHYLPIHLQPYYRALGFREGMFPEAERHGVEALTLPLYPGLQPEQQAHVIAALHRALGC